MRGVQQLPGKHQGVSRRVDTAVIVAAGMGARIGAGRGRPKPLHTVAGVPLIARVMASAAKAGIRRFVVVIGFEADRMREALPALVPEGATLDLVENPRFQDPNGVSLAAAAAVVDGAFALLMSDHIFSPDRLERALRSFAATGRSLLVVEPAADFEGDVDDATKVRVEGPHIRAIDKRLDPYDAIDTGMFVLRADDVRTALEEAGGAPSISDGMRRLAEQGALDALALTGGYWQDVDTGEDVSAAETLLYRSLTKSTDGFLARHVNRRISVFLSTRLWRWGIGPNLVTAFTLLVGLAAGWAFSRGATVGWGLLGATLFQIQSIVDGVDGELARLLHRESRFGYWFDVVADNLTHMAVFGGIALGQLASHHPGPWGVLGVLAVTGVVASFAVMAPVLAPRRRKPARGLLRTLVDGLARRDFTWLLFPLAIVGGLGVFLWAAAVGSWGYAILAAVLRLRAATSSAQDA